MESSTRVTLRPSTIATAVLTPSILLLLPHICTARSDFAPDPPVHILAYEDHLLNPYAGPLDRTGGATVHLRSEDIPRGKLILKFDFQKEQVSYIHDENLPENIYAFADNGDHIFAGGDGLAVFHKNSGKWERWSEFTTALCGWEQAEELSMWI
jgi:hypothetical protein